jgi:hypothetical protein
MSKIMVSTMFKKRTIVPTMAGLPLRRARRMKNVPRNIAGSESPGMRSAAAQEAAYAE